MGEEKETQLAVTNNGRCHFVSFTNLSCSGLTPRLTGSRARSVEGTNTGHG